MGEYKAKAPLSWEDAKFLAVLQAEMDAQPTLATADPRFWVVTQDELVTVDPESDGYDTVAYFDDDGDKICQIPAVRDDDSLYEFAEFYGAQRVCLKKERRIVSNTLFLTLRECKEHIAANKYHYTNPSSYCMCAWRSPQVKRLWRILRTTDWAMIAKRREEDEE